MDLNSRKHEVQHERGQIEKQPKTRTATRKGSNRKTLREQEVQRGRGQIEWLPKYTLPHGTSSCLEAFLFDPFRAALCVALLSYKFV